MKKRSCSKAKKRYYKVMVGDDCSGKRNGKYSDIKYSSKRRGSR